MFQLSFKLKRSPGQGKPYFLRVLYLKVSVLECFWPPGILRCKGAANAESIRTEALADIGPTMEVRAWLKAWTGISVYRDGFRIWPYGEPYDDWLRLDQRRVNNPVVRLSNNQVVGFVEISADGNPDLTDQTNREGLFNNQAFTDLRRLIHFVMQTLEAERKSGGKDVL